jgi:O-antigen/teichoic acid export membrane protein
MKFAIGIQLIIQGLTNAVQPEIFRYLKEGVKVRASEIKTLSNLFVAESISITVLAILPVMLFITMFYQTELNLSAGLITVVFVRFILTAQSQIFALPLMFAGKTRTFFYINSGVFILNLGINWLLTPVLGYYGSIIAFFSAYFMQVIIFSIIQQRFIPISWNKLKILYFPMAVVLAAIIFELLNIFLDANPFIIAAVFVILTIGSLVLLYKQEILENIPKLFKKQAGS